MRGRSIRFRGGILDGKQQVVRMPLPPAIEWALLPGINYCKIAAEEEAPPFSPRITVDRYKLVRWIDHTRIPEMQYVLTGSYNPSPMTWIQPPAWDDLLEDDLTYEPSGGGNGGGVSRRDRRQLQPRREAG